MSPFAFPVVKPLPRVPGGKHAATGFQRAVANLPKCTGLGKDSNIVHHLPSILRALAFPKRSEGKVKPVQHDVSAADETDAGKLQGDGVDGLLVFSELIIIELLAVSQRCSQFLSLLEQPQGWVSLGPRRPQPLGQVFGRVVNPLPLRVF